MITLPGDDSRDDENMVSPLPVVMFKQSCVEARSDPGPVLEIIAADCSPLARERVRLQGGGGAVCIKSRLFKNELTGTAAANCVKHAEGL
jgi:hypothetical protein